jgi:hypothetical protein
MPSANRPSKRMLGRDLGVSGAQAVDAVLRVRPAEAGMLLIRQADYRAVARGAQRANDSLPYRLALIGNLMLGWEARHPLGNAGPFQPPSSYRKVNA